MHTPVDVNARIRIQARDVVPRHAVNRGEIASDNDAPVRFGENRSDGANPGKLEIRKNSGSERQRSTGHDAAKQRQKEERPRGSQEELHGPFYARRTALQARLSKTAA